MKATRSNNRTRTALALTLLLAVSLIILYTPPFTASDLSIAPDSVEYATSAWRLVHEGRYAITINGTPYPPRYSPGFGLVALVPAYLFFTQDPGYGIYGVLIWSLVGVVAAFAIGRRIGGLSGGFMAGAALLLLPAYRQLSHIILSDATCTAAVIVLLLAYVRLTTTPHNWRRWLIAGLVAALAACIRPTILSATLPFLFLAIQTPPRRRSLLNSLVFLLPILAFITSQMLYNHIVFGSPFRSGYHYWCPVPFDYTSLNYNLSYLWLNLEATWRSGLFILVLAVGIMMLLLHRTTGHTDTGAKTSQDCLRFILLSGLPLTLFHLVYFYADPRFFLPVTGMLTVVAGAILGALLQRISNQSAMVAATGTLLLLLFVGSIQHHPKPTRRLTAELLNDTLPSRALLISNLDPVYLGFFLNREAERVILPLSRDVEYASKIVAPKRVPYPEPPPAHARDHRCPGILNGGGHDIFTATASEPGGMKKIDATLADGTPVFLDTRHVFEVQQPTVAELQRRYRILRRAEGVYELKHPSYQLR